MLRRVSAVLAVLILAITCLSAQPRQLSSFTELLGALKDGWRVRAVIEYAKCKLVVDSIEQVSPEVVGGMELSTFEYFAPGAAGNSQAYIVASENVLINHPTRGYIYDYVKLNVYADNTVHITSRYLNPQSLEILMDETFFGTISNGRDQNGVRFFVQ